MTLQCRTCGNVIYNMNAKNLFLSENAEILMNIENVAGTALKKSPQLPSHICACCLLDLKQAVVHIKKFRDRCIRTQELLQRTQTDHVENFPKGEVELNSKLLSCDELPIEIESLEDDFDDTEDELIDNNLSNMDMANSVDGPTEDADNLITSVQKEIRSICEFSSESEDTIEEEYLDNELTQNNSDSDQSKSLSISISPPTIFTNLLIDNERSNKNTNMEKFKENSKTRNINSSTAVKTKKTYISWKNLTEEEIVDRRRKQRLRDCVCDQCGRHFTDQSNFKLHMLRHTGVKNFKCKECSKLFYTDHLLQLHERTVHRGERPYACKYCDKTFNNSTTRVLHERSHTNMRPYSCDFCDKTFICASALKRHDLTHNGVRAFYCNICDKTFQRNTHLKAHLRSKQHAMKENNINSLQEIE